MHAMNFVLVVTLRRVYTLFFYCFNYNLYVPCLARRINLEAVTFALKLAFRAQTNNYDYYTYPSLWFNNPLLGVTGPIR